MLKIEEFEMYSLNNAILTIEDLSLEQGSFTYIQGHNSTGKSLFLKSLTGQYKHFKGNLTFKKQQLSDLQNNILLLNHELPVVKSLSFVENIQISMGKLGPNQKNRMMEMATKLDIVNILEKKMEFCSRSEKMFMYLIRATLICPNILLIDDIDNFFDLVTFKKVYQIFPFCIKSGMLIISTGKAHVENIPTYIIESGELQKNHY